MAFNYAKEKQQFNREWEKNLKEYKSAGMPEEKILKMKDFDWEWFCSRRRYENRTQALTNEVIDENGDNAELTTLFRKFKSLSVEMTLSSVNGRSGWVEEIEDERLCKKVKKLSEDDLELLTLLVFDGFSQAEIVRQRGCSKNAISKKYKRIINFFK